MNVEIGAEAAQFPEKEYINVIAVAVQGKHTNMQNMQTNTMMAWQVKKLYVCMCNYNYPRPIMV
jgi:hypothetical protein